MLFWKKRAEEELQRSGLTYTIVRPGGLKSKLGDGESAGNVVMAAPGTYGFPPRKSGSILRTQVRVLVRVYALRQGRVRLLAVSLCCMRSLRAMSRCCLLHHPQTDTDPPLHGLPVCVCVCVCVCVRVYSQVAEVCVAALTEPAAANKVVEVIAEKDAPAKAWADLFSAVNWF